MDKKIWLTEGYCPEDGYNCLMPVQYVAVEKNGVIEEYVKESMACRHMLDGTCTKAEECKILHRSPEKLEKNAKWYEA